MHRKAVPQFGQNAAEYAAEVSGAKVNCLAIAGYGLRAFVQLGRVR